jgi:hypothetical protein
MGLDVASGVEDEVEELAAAVEALDEAEEVLGAADDEVAAALDEEDDVEEVAAALDEEDEVVEVVDAVLEVEEDVVLELVVETAPAGLYWYTLSLSEPPQVSAGLPPQGITQPPSGEGTLPASSTLPQ